MQQYPPELLCGSSQPQEVIWMEMPEYLVLGRTYVLIGRAVGRTSCKTSSGMLTKHASLPDLLLRWMVGVPDDLRLAARFCCSTGSSSDELSSKSYLRFLRSLSWRSPEVEATDSGSMGGKRDDGREEMVGQRVAGVGSFKGPAKPRPCPGIYIDLTYTNASRTCLVARKRFWQAAFHLNRHGRSVPNCRRPQGDPQSRHKHARSRRAFPHPASGPAKCDPIIRICASPTHARSTGTGIALSQLVLAQDAEISLRQMSHLFLCVYRLVDPDTPSYLLGEHHPAQIHQRTVVTHICNLQGLGTSS